MRSLRDHRPVLPPPGHTSGRNSASRPRLRSQCGAPIAAPHSVVSNHFLSDPPSFRHPHPCGASCFPLASLLASFAPPSKQTPYTSFCTYFSPFSGPLPGTGGGAFPPPGPLLRNQKRGDVPGALHPEEGRFLCRISPLLRSRVPPRHSPDHSAPETPQQRTRDPACCICTLGCKRHRPFSRRTTGSSQSVSPRQTPVCRSCCSATSPRRDQTSARHAQSTHAPPAQRRQRARLLPHCANRLPSNLRT